ncbi:Fc.00g023070.m01.CDS01 [Cosmosporella sp. VM-42]
MGSAQVLSARSRSTYPKTPQKRTLQTAGSSKAGKTPEHPIVLDDDDSSPSTFKKRKAEVSSTPSGSAKKVRKEKGNESKEKRLRKFRPQPPQAFQDVYARALSQRFYVLNRERCGSDECPREIVEMTGSTGNIYTVVIAEQPTCNCPHAQKGNQCKHVLYVSDYHLSKICEVMKRVLNAPYEHVYQLALVPSELRNIFAAAPPISAPRDAEAESNKRKPLESDCPICFCEFESQEAVVWCKAACGQNIHKQCFETWARTKTGGKVTCPFCRSQWQGDEDVSKLGISRHRGMLMASFEFGILLTWMQMSPRIQSGTDVLAGEVPRDGVARTLGVAVGEARSAPPFFRATHFERS